MSGIRDLPWFSGVSGIPAASSMVGKMSAVLTVVSTLVPAGPPPGAATTSGTCSVESNRLLAWPW